MSIAPLEAPSSPEGEHGLLQPRYDLNPAECSVAIHDYVTSHEVPQGFRYIGVVLSDEDGQIANAVRTHECAVFQEAFPGNDAAWMKGTYKEADAQGRKFLTVLDLGDREKDEQPKVIGDMSTLDTPPYLSLEDAAEHIPFSVDDIRAYHGIGEGEKVVDILTIAIDRAYRAKIIEGTSAISLLEGMFLRYGIGEGWQHVVSMIDSKARRLFDAIGAPFKLMCDYDHPFEYFGSPATYALYGNLSEFAPSITDKYIEYGRRAQRLGNVATSAETNAEGNPQSPAGAAKRLGFYLLTESIITGTGVIDRVKLPDSALALKLI